MQAVENGHKIREQADEDQKRKHDACELHGEFKLTRHVHVRIAGKKKPENVVHENRREDRDCGDNQKQNRKYARNEFFLANIFFIARSFART